jgi:hypothetical protein
MLPAWCRPAIGVALLALAVVRGVHVLQLLANVPGVKWEWSRPNSSCNQKNEWAPLSPLPPLLHAEDPVAALLTALAAAGADVESVRGAEFDGLRGLQVRFVAVNPARGACSCASGARHSTPRA